METLSGKGITMIHVSPDDVRKIAKISYIALPEDEVEIVRTELEQVLNYAQRVIDAAAQEGAELVADKNVNVFRVDVAAPQNPEPILAQAPERIDRYFVVPKILDN